MILSVIIKAPRLVPGTKFTSIVPIRFMEAGGISTILNVLFRQISMVFIIIVKREKGT